MRRSVASLAWLIGCGADEPASLIGPVPAYEQRTGDAEAGFWSLVEEGYVGCGIPTSVWDRVAGPAPMWSRIPGRTGRNAELPYNLTAFTTASGVEVVSPNCLQCHAEVLGGEVVIGLGNHTADYSEEVGLYPDMACALVDDPVEHDECMRWRDRTVAISPYIVTRTAGVNPADNIAAVLFAHRDQETLAWSEEPLLELPPAIVVPVDVPPWWRMQRKNAMFYDGAGRGDHARIMMTASTLCIESVEEAQAIDAYFPDVRAFLLDIEPPSWPYALNADLAATGKDVFDATCARCHGSYGDDGGGADGDGGSYPNLVIAIEEVGTDATLATGASQFADRFVDWFNGSFYGELSSLEPAPGYMAPPLDGIWATAPFLHNGSVPTLRALLDSSLRQPRFERSFDPDDYDPTDLGWPSVAIDAAAFADHEQRSLVYDTSQLGYSNAGHTFGDALSAAQRDALLEYLKTL